MLAVPLRNRLREGNIVNLRRRNFVSGSYSGSNMYVLAVINTKNISVHCKVLDVFCFSELLTSLIRQLMQSFNKDVPYVQF